ncbi:PR-1-like protein [Coprinellus micaceus]|uniref:PR-1-like protein n=1 Tax=Coprinellus micaceus TaxID=71717 RepID=A0A4Y7U075_COPMI|nr:PR-1-like protein [Coprinellus micaceus]
MILHFKRLAAVIFVLVGTVSSTGATSEGPRCSCKSEGQSERQQYLDAHNTVRGRYGAEDLVWDNAAATAAQVWADNCRFAHEDDSLYGENIAAGPSDLNIRSAIQFWADEESEYDPSNPQASHFTQVVWKSTTGVGCASAQCTGIFGIDLATFYVCKYSPPGNVLGEFDENVQF